MRKRKAGRRCRQCGESIHWNTARFVGSRAFCWEPCAVLWLSGVATRTAWSRALLQTHPRSHSPAWWVRLLWASWIAAIVQRRLDRRLDASPRVQQLPWFWLPSLRGATALLVALAACGLSGGRGPETHAMAIMTAGPTSSPRVAVVTPPVPAFESASPVPPPAIPVPSPTPEIGRPLERPVLPERPKRAGVHALTRGTAEDVTRGDLSARQLALTFDGGSEANVVGEILDSLRARGVRATMFLTGQFIRLNPGWVRRMVADGHEVGNHLDTHPHLTTYERNHRQQTLPGVTRDFLINQLHRAEESFYNLTGKPMVPFWRAPFGEHNAEIRAWAAEAGYRHVSWTRGAGTAEDLDTRDWVADRSSRIYRSREEIAARLVALGHRRPEGLNGGIVLMHLGTHRRTDRPHESLPEILTALQDQGYRLVTLSELLRRLPTDQTPPHATPSSPADDGQLPPQ